MRSAAQIVSYEIPAVMILLTVVMIVGSLSLQDIVLRAGGRAARTGSSSATSRSCPSRSSIFFTAGLAECNRAPFDIPEAESELVAGFHTEYSGFFFAMFFMAEYTEMFVISAVASVLFLGGWWAPHPGAAAASGPSASGPSGCIAKAWFLVFVMMWLRWTLPRLRVDQLMYVAWKVLLPIAHGPGGGGRRPADVAADAATASPGTATWAGRSRVGLFGFLLVGDACARVRWSAARGSGAGGMKQWLQDVWEGFYTVLVGMKITWRHLFVEKVTLHYPEEKWQLPPKSRMRLFMKYEDCIGCGQCARACPVQCIYIKAEKRDPKAPPIFAANGQPIKLDVTRLRHRHVAVLLLQPVHVPLPDRLHLHDAGVRVRDHRPDAPPVPLRQDEREVPDREPEAAGGRSRPRRAAPPAPPPATPTPPAAPPAPPTPPAPPAPADAARRPAGA